MAGVDRERRARLPAAAARPPLRLPDPRGDAGEVVPGVRVKVPLRVAGRVADGFVVGLADTTDAPGELSDDRPRRVAGAGAAPEVWRLARAVADRGAGVATRRAADRRPEAAGARRAAVAEATGREPGAVDGAGDSAAATRSSRAGGSPPLADPHPVERSTAHRVGGWAAELADTAAAAVAAAGRSVDRRGARPPRPGPARRRCSPRARPRTLVLRIDASQPAAERYRAHLAALEPGPHVLIGTRSAVYAPAPDLGAILVWDEADAVPPGAARALRRAPATWRSCGRSSPAPGCCCSPTPARRPCSGSSQVGWLDRLARAPRAAARRRAHPRRRPRRRASRRPRGVRLPAGCSTAARVLVQVAAPGRTPRCEALQRRRRPAADRRRPHRARARPRLPGRAGDHRRRRARARRRRPQPADSSSSTRGAEPRAPGGYRAVLLLDGAPDARPRVPLGRPRTASAGGRTPRRSPARTRPCTSSASSGDVATALATWRFRDFAARQLADRRTLRFPPAVRARDRRPARDAGAGPRRGARGGRGAEVLLHGADRPGERAVAPLRLRRRPRLAAIAKAALVKAGSRPPPEAARPARRRSLRVRFDPHEPLLAASIAGARSSSCARSEAPESVPVQPRTACLNGADREVPTCACSSPGRPMRPCPSLDALAASAHEIVRVVTRAAGAAGRTRVLTPSPGRGHGRRARPPGAPREPPRRRRDRASSPTSGPTSASIVAYGGLVSEPLLSAPRLGWVNLHFSLLPRWRGAAPVQRALMAGDGRPASSVFQLEAGLDTGPVLAARAVADRRARDGRPPARAARAARRRGARGRGRRASPTAPRSPCRRRASPPSRRSSCSRTAGSTGRRRPSRVRASAASRPSPAPSPTVADRRLKVLDAAPARDAPRSRPARSCAPTAACSSAAATRRSSWSACSRRGAGRCPPTPGSAAPATGAARMSAPPRSRDQPGPPDRARGPHRRPGARRLRQPPAARAARPAAPVARRTRPSRPSSPTAPCAVAGTTTRVIAAASGRAIDGDRSAAARRAAARRAPAPRAAHRPARGRAPVRRAGAGRPRARRGRLRERGAAPGRARAPRSSGRERAHRGRHRPGRAPRPRDARIPPGSSRSSRRAADQTGGDADLDPLLEVDDAAPPVGLVALPGLADPTSSTGAAPAPRCRRSASSSTAATPAACRASRQGRAGAGPGIAARRARADAAPGRSAAGERWLDLCAGPGGKAALLAAEAAAGGASLLANELMPARARLVERALAAGAGRRPRRDRRRACGSPTATRTLRPDPARRALHRPRRAPPPPGGALAEAAGGRARARGAAGRAPRRGDRALAPGGLLAYVTCSPVVAETTDVVAAALERHPGLRRARRPRRCSTASARRRLHRRASAAPPPSSGRTATAPTRCSCSCSPVS